MPMDADVQAGSRAGLPLEALGQPTAVVDAAGQVHMVNTAFTRLVGDTAEALCHGHRSLIHILSDEGPPTDLIDAAAGMPLPANGIGALTRADGEVVDVAWTLGAWPQADEILYVVTCTDISEDKCLSCAIKGSREKYRQAFDDQTELVCRFGPDTRILFVNGAYAAAFGQTPAQMIGQRLTDYLGADDQRAFLAYLSTFTPQDCLREGDESFELAGGRAVHQHWRRRAIFRRDGRVAAFQSVGRDLTESKRQEQERARLERIVTASPIIGVRMAWGRAQRVDYVSANVARLGYSPEDLTEGRVPVIALVHPADRRRLYRDLRTQAGTGATQFRQVFRLRTRDRQTLWAEASIQPERSAKGDITHLELVVADVSDYMRARDKVRESERRLHDFATAANDWFWETDDGLRFIWFSEGINERFGIDLSGAVGLRRWDLVEITDAADGWEAHRAQMEARQPFRDFRYTIEMGDSGKRRVSVSGRPVFAADGTFLGYRGSSTDITDQENALAALAESRRRYETIFNLTEVALLDEDFSDLMQRLDALRAAGVKDLEAWLREHPDRVADIVGRVRLRHVNPAALALHGAATQDELLDLIRRNASKPDGITFYTTGLVQLWEGHDVVRYEGQRIRTDGTSVEVLHAFRAPRSVEESRHVVISMFDISDRLEAERAMRRAMDEARLANRAKSEFLANMSHELRTPLNAIIGFSDVLSHEIFGPMGSTQYVDYARGILESGRHLLAIITDILDLSKVEAGSLQVVIQAVDLATTVDAAVDLAAGRAVASGLTMVNRVPADTTVHADPLRLKQILINLLSNAAKFTDAGGQVTVAAWHDDDAQMLVVEVADSGIGMSPDDIAVALTLFGQVQSPFARQANHGTGLGLPICRSLMEAHGGSLDIDSTPGTGTRVRLRFPLSPA